jgi:hypothetical protein
MNATLTLSAPSESALVPKAYAVKAIARAELRLRKLTHFLDRAQELLRTEDVAAIHDAEHVASCIDDIVSTLTLVTSLPRETASRVSQMQLVVRDIIQEAHRNIRNR